MVMPMMNGPAMGPRPMGPGGGGADIDKILVSKVIALPMELKQTLLEIITKMEPSSASPVAPGLEGNLAGPPGGGGLI